MSKQRTPSTKAAAPLQENDEAARRRLEELPDQPQENAIRGFGAMNPIEGEIEAEGRRGEEGTGGRGA